MKWCFLLDPAYLIGFLSRLSQQVIKEGDECIVIANSKISEYELKKHFPKEVKLLSKVDWCLKNYKRNQEEFSDLSWKEFFSTFD